MLRFSDIPSARPVLIAGPTASGKSSLALAIAEQAGGQIINADALQVFENWRVLTARPSDADEARAQHKLYGHVPRNADYSVGHWLRDLKPLLHEGQRPIIVGGTGLYFSALTDGLVEIPAIPEDVRAEANARLAHEGLSSLLAELDPTTTARLDTKNPMRVQRAWEVRRATGRSLSDWQDNTPPPMLPLSTVTPLLIDAPKDWLTPRIERRFDLMLDGGALDEARANLTSWSPTAQSAKAIGAPELIKYLKGEMTLDAARTAAIIATRQYAKRQRTWFRARMRDWQILAADQLP